MDGSQSVRGSISLDRDSEPSRIEPELWSQVYQRLVPVRFVRTLREQTPVEAVVDKPRTVRDLVPAA